MGVDARTASEWLSALRSLEDRGLIEALSENHDFFKVTGGLCGCRQVEEFAVGTRVLLRCAPTT